MDASIGEALCRAALREAFPGHAFDKTRREPWLQGLELDCYDLALRLGLEYQGKQHYEFVPYFHQDGPRDFEAQLMRDSLKRDRADRAWVTILEVPYTVPHREIREHVRCELVGLGYRIAPTEATLEEFMALALANGRLVVVMLEKARSIARSHGGSCLSESYVDCHELLEFTCARGHTFEAPLAAVNAADHPRPRFCPECGGTRRRTFEENEELVKPSGYKLIDVDSVPVGKKESVTRFYLKCPAGHEFDSLRNNFLPVTNSVPRRGCIRCARKRTNRAKGLAIRKERLVGFGLVALSEYRGRHETAKWRCVANRHEFDASWNTINARKGRKCLMCPS